MAGKLISSAIIVAFLCWARSIIIEVCFNNWSIDLSNSPKLWFFILVAGVLLANCFSFFEPKE